MLFPLKRNQNSVTLFYSNSWK